MSSGDRPPPAGAEPPLEFTLIEGGEVYAPEPLGTRGLLVAGETLVRVGDVDRRALDALAALGFPVRTVDARGLWVLPGFVDAHEHLIGAGGEHGFSSRQPEVPRDSLVRAGITTAVGCLGTDTTTRHLTSLLAKVRQLREEGLSAYMYTGGYPVPTPTITASVQDDLVIVDAVIGVGELAIADARSVEPPLPLLAAVVAQALVGGSLAGKAGVAHFHVGEGKRRLACLRALIADFDVPARTLFPIHIDRSRPLLEEAVALARAGAAVGMDTVEDDLPRWLTLYRDLDGALPRLIVATDAHTEGAEPDQLRRNVAACLRERVLPPERVFPVVTRNPASALGLPRKGRLAPGADADVLVVAPATLDVVHVFARGRQVMRDGVVGP